MCLSPLPQALLLLFHLHTHMQPVKSPFFAPALPTMGRISFDHHPDGSVARGVASTFEIEADNPHLRTRFNAQIEHAIHIEFTSGYTLQSNTISIRHTREMYPPVGASVVREYTPGLPKPQNLLAKVTPSITYETKDVCMSSTVHINHRPRHIDTLTKDSMLIQDLPAFEPYLRKWHI